MKFSVAIPAYKPDFLKQAIQSVLAQSCGDFELVIVDDASPFGLSSIVSPFLTDSRVRFYQNEKNFGALDVVDNWNRCLDYCIGDYVICMGDDDRLLPNCLADLKDVIGKYPGLGVYHIQAEVIDENGRLYLSLPPRPEMETSLDLLDRRWRRGSCQYIGDFCFDVARLKADGGFYKTPLAWGADDITSFRASKEGIANTTSIGFQYRFNPSSLSSNHDNKLKFNVLLQVSEWFGEALDNYKPAPDEENKLADLRRRRQSHFRMLCDDFIVSDIISAPNSFTGWLKSRKEYGLSLCHLYFLLCKGLLLRLFVRTS